MIYEKDLFDYRNGEPPEHFLTVLRALDVSLIFFAAFFFTGIDTLLDLGPICATYLHQSSAY